MIVVFSKDRAFQLEACLRTLRQRCEDIAAVPVRVVWTASTVQHREAYDLLRRSLAEAPTIEFVAESNFRADLIAILGGLRKGSWQDGIMRSLNATRAMKGPARSLINLLLRPEPTVLFAVDDTLFLRPFNFAECSRLLLSHDEALAFSLRLGEGLTRFYMGNRDQKVPSFIPVDPVRQIVQFPWPEAEGDFEYPLEVSSSILKLPLLLPRLLRKEWRSPNTLEMALAKMAGRYRATHPVLLTYRQPRAVAVPLNMVQKDYTDNRHGGQERHHPDRLCALFLQGVRADLSGLDAVRPISVHAELELLQEPV